MLQETRCDRCDWRYGGFHICVDLDTPKPKIVLPKRKKTRSLSDRARAEARLTALNAKNAIRDEEAVAKYKSGLSMVEVASVMGINHLTVRRILHRARACGELIIRKPGRDATDLVRDSSIVTLYSEGKTYREIGEDLDVSASTIRRALVAGEEAGLVTIRPTGVHRRTAESEDRLTESQPHIQLDSSTS